MIESVSKQAHVSTDLRERVKDGGSFPGRCGLGHRQEEMGEAATTTPLAPVPADNEKVQVIGKLAKVLGLELDPAAPHAPVRLAMDTRGMSATPCARQAGNGNTRTVNSNAEARSEPHVVVATSTFS